MDLEELKKLKKHLEEQLEAVKREIRKRVK